MNAKINFTIRRLIIGIGVCFFNIIGSACNKGGQDIRPLTISTQGGAGGDGGLAEILKCLSNMQKTYATKFVSTKVNGRIEGEEKFEKEFFEEYTGKYEKEKVEFLDNEVGLGDFVKLVLKNDTHNKKDELAKINPTNLRKILVKIMQNYFGDTVIYDKANPSNRSYKGNHMINGRVLGLVEKTIKEWRTTRDEER